MSDKRYYVPEGEQREVRGSTGALVMSFCTYHQVPAVQWARVVSNQLNDAYEAGQRDPIKEAPEPEPQPVDEVPEGYEVWGVEIRHGLHAAINPQNTDVWYALGVLPGYPRFVRLYGYRTPDGRLKWSNRDRMWREKGESVLDLTPCDCGNLDIQSEQIEDADPVLPDAVLMRKGEC